MLYHRVTQETARVLKGAGQQTKRVEQEGWKGKMKTIWMKVEQKRDAKARI